MKTQSIVEDYYTCKNCSHFVDKGYKLDPDPEYGSNPAEKPSCFLFSHHDYDYDWTSWWPTLPDNYCSWWEDKEKS